MTGVEGAPPNISGKALGVMGRKRDVSILGESTDIEEDEGKFNPDVTLG